MARQIILDEKFTSIQEAQSGLYKLLESAKETGRFYRVLKNNKPVGVLLPNKTWESLMEDLEALSSKKYIESIRKARVSDKRYTSSQIKKKLGLD